MDKHVVPQSALNQAHEPTIQLSGCLSSFVLLPCSCCNHNISPLVWGLAFYFSLHLGIKISHQIEGTQPVWPSHFLHYLILSLGVFVYGLNAGRGWPP